MKLTAQVKLVVTPEQAGALKKTMAEANACCNRLSEWAWQNQTFGQYALHKARYSHERAASGLTAQVVVRCNGKVADAYKLDKQTRRVFRPDGAIAYDDRILRWYTQKGEVSIWTVAGRMKLPFTCGEHQRAMLTSQQGESDLAYHDGKFFLLTTCNLPDPPMIEADGVLGIDLGIVQLATDSEGRIYSGEPVKAVRRRMKRLRAYLQRCKAVKKSRNARKHLQKVRRRQSNFVRHTNHCLSKAIVKAALVSRKALALEDLSGIRERASAFSREMRWQVGNWAFDQLKGFIVYKAKQAGIAVRFVDPRNTSRTCSACGHCDKTNRKSQSQFLCLQCGLGMNADVNAAINIGVRGAVTHPINAHA